MSESQTSIVFAMVHNSTSDEVKRWKKIPVIIYTSKWASLMAQLVKNLPAVQEIWVQSLGWEDPLEKGTAAHSSILAWRIPWTEEPGGLQSMWRQRDRTECLTHTPTQLN